MGSARPFMAAIGISLFIAAGFPARQATAQQATASTAETLARLSATIAGQYPSARVLVLARGNCILHEYYAANNSPAVPWPMHSVTKSVLSVLVGIAIDRGLLRLDQKLPELVAEATEGTIDPRAADVTLRDLLTMTSGFAPHEMVEVPGVWNSSVWMIRRTVKYPPGTYFYYDDQGANLIAIILSRAVGGNIAEFAKNELFAPLQIDRYQWAVDGDGNLPGYSGLLLTGRDMAKIGLLYLQQGRWRERQVARSAFTPSVSVIMVVRDEETALPVKLQNLTALDYPHDRLEILVVSDGSTDGSDAILRQWAEQGAIRPIFVAEHNGKAFGLNQAIPVAQGEVVVFTDVRQTIEPKAIRLLAENFADASVGCASGELMLGDPQGEESASGMGLYWRVEKKVRELESLSGSTIGATGALYAARKNLLVELPPDLILDDVFLPMSVLRQGFRVVFDPRARAWDKADLGTGREFWRKVRTLSGNYQLVEAAPWLVSRENPSRWDFISHKLLRLVVPFALAGLLLSSAWLSGPFFLTCLVAQIGFYTLSLLAAIPARLGLVGRVADAAPARIPNRHRYAESGPGPPRSVQASPVGRATYRDRP